jgi:amidophosphoribosyltransferase
MDEETLYAARDPQGIRPLVLGRLERGWVVASETAALDIVGATFIREITPGELIAVDANGLRSRTFAKADPKGCLFEYVYLARPDTMISGQRLHSVRVAVGRTLARECPADGDLVIPVPESGTPAAIGYAEASESRTGRGWSNSLRRAHLHSAEPDHSPARHPVEVEPAAGCDRRDALGGGR